MKTRSRRRTIGGSRSLAIHPRMSNGCAPRFKSTSCSAAALAGPALGAHSAGAGPDHFVAAAMRTDDVHEHVSERFLDAIGVTAAVRRNLGFAIVGRMARDYV